MDDSRERWSLPRHIGKLEIDKRNPNQIDHIKRRIPLDEYLERLWTAAISHSRYSVEKNVYVERFWTFEHANCKRVPHMRAFQVKLMFKFKTRHINTCTFIGRVHFMLLCKENNLEAYGTKTSCTNVRISHMIYYCSRTRLHKHKHPTDLIKGD